MAKTTTTFLTKKELDDTFNCKYFFTHVCALFRTEKKRVALRAVSKTIHDRQTRARKKVVKL